jgi:hypothetical protein
LHLTCVLLLAFAAGWATSKQRTIELRHHKPRRSLAYTI